MIWKFDNHNVFVLGSVHMMREGQNNHINSINQTLDLVSSVVFETSLDFGDFPITQFKDEKLSNNISKSLFRDTR